MIADLERWAEAFAIDKQHGDMASCVIAERIRTLSLAGDDAGIARWQEIAVRLDQLRVGTMQ